MAIIPTSGFSKFHVWVTGGVLTDIVGNAWNKIGTPTFDSAVSIPAANGANAEGVRGFSLADYFEANAASTGYFNGDWALTALVKFPNYIGGGNTCLYSRGDTYTSYVGGGTPSTGMTVFLRLVENYLGSPINTLYYANISQYMEGVTGGPVGMEGFVINSQFLPNQAVEHPWVDVPYLITITKSGNTGYLVVNSLPPLTYSPGTLGAFNQTNSTVKARIGHSYTDTVNVPFDGISTSSSFYGGTIYEMRLISGVTLAPTDIRILHNSINGNASLTYGMPNVAFAQPLAMTLQDTPETIPFPIELNRQGNIGFQLEGGIITVVATSPKVRVTFDRPMTYNGSYSDVPGGTPYSIGPPVQTVDTLALDIPINVPAGTLTGTVAIVGPYTLTVTWTETVTLIASNPSFWNVTNTTGTPVTVNSVSSTGPITTITTSEHTQGGAYTLHVPAVAVQGVSGMVNSAITTSYTGIGQTPTLYTLTGFGPQALLLTYSEDMDTASATDMAHYSIPGLTIYSIVAQSPSQYIINTSVIAPNTTYILTVIGTVDKANNPVI